ncbi:GNAT family N-acetyltransferase [Pelagibius litoralis]|uniref:GNAT family N-acetyltransferase n=1 Tax=Pelagibius litoralis TaxID=374515 RepID=A0A967C374_9PROT|nr:GNAT family N-acetyltransferase [Pelagibius litoralis]NIA67365.1 GNAT family N-acetyltransferase [Pelagibius litoralis]
MPEHIQYDPAIEPIKAADCLLLRHRVLRPNQTLADCHYPLDEAIATLHLGYRDAAGRVIGIASVFHEAPPDSDPLDSGSEQAWRIRGMAVEPEAQGRGIGAALLAGLIAYTTAQTDSQSDEGLLWCNGRSTVEPFYLAQGFERVGDIFDLPPIGPHVLLQRRLIGR